MSRRRDWLAGVVVGASAGFLLVYGFVFGVLLTLAFAIPAALGRSTAAIGGLLAGAGAVILVMLTLANLRCAGLLGADDGGCTPPDLTGWFAAGAVMAVSGVVLTLLAAVRSRRG